MIENWSFPHTPQLGSRILDWEAILKDYDWLHALGECPQDPVYHAEGDVLIHTRMVSASLAEDADWQELAPDERSILFASTLLHDIAKPQCTVKQNGPIRSPGHSVKGKKLAQRLLYQEWIDPENPIPFDARQKIVYLVRHHGIPLWFLEKSHPQRAVIESGLYVNNQWTATLARADVLGRICDDQNELLERIDLFVEFCKENHCLDDPYPFRSHHQRYLFLSQQASWPDHDRFDETTFEVVMMSGLPGAGKDTWIKDNLPDLPVISLDAIRDQSGISPTENQSKVVETAKEHARQFLRKQQPFIWNATNITKQIRQGLLNLFSSYNARTCIMYVETDWKTLLERNKSREKTVPKDVLYKLANRLEIPEYGEAHRVDYEISQIA